MKKVNKNKVKTIVVLGPPGTYCEQAAIINFCGIKAWKKHLSQMKKLRESKASKSGAMTK